MEIDVSMFDYVDFEDVADTDQKIGTLGDVVQLSDDISSHRFLESSSDLIRWQELMSYNAVLHDSMSESLVLTDEIYHCKGVADDFIQFFDSFFGNYHTLQDSLVLVETMDGSAGQGILDTLLFSEVMIGNSVVHRGFSDTITFNGNISGIKYNYHQPISPLPPPPPPPPPPANNVTFTSLFGLAPPVTFPAPKFGDSRTTNFKRINKTSRGDDIIISGEDNWHPTFLHKLEWEYLSERNLDKLRAFMKAHVGIPVSVHSHYGETWKVIFLRPDVEFSQVGRENRTVTLDMQIVQ